LKPPSKLVGSVLFIVDLIQINSWHLVCTSNIIAASTELETGSHKLDRLRGFVQTNESFDSSIMATDIRTLWFEAIDSANRQQLTRFLFNTPTPQVGAQRLKEWTTEVGKDICDKLPLELKPTMKVQTLLYSILKYLLDAGNNRFDLIKLILSVSSALGNLIGLFFG
jgi:hypothetical protein